jgi:hypothetical protein
MSNNASNLIFGLYNSSGVLKANAPASSSTTPGLITLTWTTPYTFYKGEKFWIGFYGAISNVVIGKILSNSNIPGTGVTISIDNTPWLVSTTSWSGGVPLNNIPVSPNITTSTLLTWYKIH